MSFATHFIRPLTEYEPGGGEVITEQAGYVPAKRKIEEMIYAGKRLVESRREQFDSVDDSEPEIDPTRDPNFDLADASILKRQVASRLRAQKARRLEEIELLKEKRETPAVEPKE